MQVDRRVQLRVGPEGLWFAPWGARAIPWSEFESFSVFDTWRNVYHLQANPTSPARLRARLPAVSRLHSSLHSRIGWPPFCINQNPLDISLAELLEAVSWWAPVDPS